MPRRLRRPQGAASSEPTFATFVHSQSLNPHTSAHFEQGALSYGRGVLDDVGNLSVYWFTPWGIDADGHPYFDPNGAAEGQEARLTRVGGQWILDTNLDA